jgi:hypothetical protein
MLRGVSNDPLEAVLPGGGLGRRGTAVWAAGQGDDATALYLAERAKESTQEPALIAAVELRALEVLILMADGEVIH